MQTTLRSRTALLLGTAMLALSPAPALADDSDANEIVVYGRTAGYVIDSSASPTKTDTALIDVPQSIAILNRSQLDDQAVQSLNDALLYVPGVVLEQGEGHRDQVTLRGQASTADFFIDGLRDDAQYYRPLYNTERVEVLKGANAMIFGRGGGGGVINRVSKTADLADSAMDFAASVGSMGEWSLAADINQPLSENAALRINAIREEMDSHRDTYGGHFTGLAPTLGLKLGEATSLTLAYEFDSDRRVTDRGIPSITEPGKTYGRPMPGQYRTFFGAPGINRSKVDAHVARARFDHGFSDSLSGNLTAQYASYDKFYANVLPRAATSTTVDLQGYASGTRRENAIVQGNLVWKVETFGMAHTLLAGFEAAQQDTDSDRVTALFGTSGTTTSGPIALTRPIVLPTISLTGATRDTSSDVRALSAYVQDQIELGRHVQLVGGVRFDDFRIRSIDRVSGFKASRSDAKWSPRLGIIIKPQDNISLYASHAVSFLPQSGDQFTVLDAVTATLAPEKFENLEAGVKWDIAPDLGMTAAVYRLDRSNSRSTDPVTGNPVLTGKSRSKGFEVSLAGRITPEWQASLGYARQDGEIRSATTSGPAGRRLANLPKHQLSAWTRYDVSPQLGLGLGLVHQSAKFASISNAVRLPGYTRIDAALYYTVSDAFKLQLNAENLTDRRYYPSAHTDNNIATGEPFNVKLTARFTL